jgi:3-phytase
MKILQFTYVLFVSALLSACQTITVQNKTDDKVLSVKQITIQGQEAHPIYLSNDNGWLVVDASEGLTWANRDFTSVSNWQGKVATIDWRISVEQPELILIAVLDSDTSAIHLLHFDFAQASFSKLTSLAANKSDIEGLCLGDTGDGLSLFSIDTLGVLQHHAIHIESIDGQLSANLQSIRSLNIGPNMTDCAVMDNTHQLLIAEEEIGIWKYDALSEGENERQLMRFPAPGEVESISTGPSDYVFAVSPDVNNIWAFDASDYTQLGSVQKDIRLPDNIRLSSINIANDPTKLLFGAYDESQQQLYAMEMDWQNKQVASQTERSSNLSHSHQSDVDEVASFYAAVETESVQRFGDAADDPAIWINETQADKSLIFGTDKKYGLNVYSLSGELVQTLPVGKINNIDIRQNILVNGEYKDIAVASNRSNQSITVFSINEQGFTHHLVDIPTDLNDVYGLCLYKHNDQIDVFINDTDGQFNRYQLVIKPSNIAATKIDQFQVDSQPEGCVVDDDTKRLFFGEEAVGIWKMQLDNINGQPELIAKAHAPVEPDIEGMGIYNIEGEKFLVVSSQGNNRFAIYRIDANNELLGVFEIVANRATGIDAVSETDGIEVTSIALGDSFPKGLLVVQDGRNVMPMAPQNFKLVSGSYLHDFITQKIGQLAH